jgi:hypothetical protein
MTRRPVRILGFLLGACLLIGAVTSLLLWLHPDTGSWRQYLRELGGLVDVFAVLLWMLIFFLYRNRSGG